MEFKYEIVKTDAKEFKIPISEPEIINARYGESDIVSIIDDFRKRGYTIVNESKEYADNNVDFIFQFDIMSYEGLDFRIRFDSHGQIKFFPRDEDGEMMKEIFDEFDEILGKRLS